MHLVTIWNVRFLVHAESISVSVSPDSVLLGEAKRGGGPVREMTKREPTPGSALAREILTAHRPQRTTATT